MSIDHRSLVWVSGRRTCLLKPFPRLRLVECRHVGWLGLAWGLTRPKQHALTVLRTYNPLLKNPKSNPRQWQSRSPGQAADQTREHSHFFFRDKLQIYSELCAWQTFFRAPGSRLEINSVTIVIIISSITSSESGSSPPPPTITSIMCSAEAATPPDAGSKLMDTGISRNPNRRSNKPIMEKRRRARINNCLNELKAILLEAMRKDPARHSKLEKADILELTVSHLKTLHQSGPQGEAGSRFRAGFAECANEVGRFLGSPKAEGIDPSTSGRLLAHLSDCLNNPHLPPMLMSPAGADHVHNHPQSVTATTLNVPPNTPVISLVPSRLSSGEIAFVVPGFNSSSLRAAAGYSPATGHGPNTPAMPVPHQPMLSPEVPLELTVGSRFGSTNSPSSSSSSSASSLSPAYPGHYAHHHHHHYGYAQLPPGHHGHASYGQQPLALVTPKKEEGVDMSCWRPW